MIHVLRNIPTNEDDDTNLTRNDFESRLKTLKLKCKEKYSFILNSGEGLKNCIFDLFSKIWTNERKPEKWKNTVLVQNFKGGEGKCL